MRVKMIFGIILLFAVIVVTGCTGKGLENDVITYKDISSEQLSSMMKNKDFTLIDVHVPEQEHIVGTDKLIPYNQITQRMGELPTDLSAKIVVYCRSGSMSRTASEELVNMGYTNVYNLVGGRNDWVAKGFDN